MGRPGFAGYPGTWQTRVGSLLAFWLAFWLAGCYWFFWWTSKKRLPWAWKIDVFHLLLLPSVLLEVQCIPDRLKGVHERVSE